MQELYDKKRWEKESVSRKSVCGRERERERERGRERERDRVFVHVKGGKSVSKGEGV